MMLAMCSAPLHVRLQPVKSTVLMHVVYFTLWQMTLKEEKGKTMRTSISTLMCVSIKLYLNINMHTFQALI